MAANISRAYSKKSVRTSINGVIKTTQAQNPDVAFYQEIDPDGDRSQHVNEVKMVTRAQQQSRQYIRSEL